MHAAMHAEQLIRVEPDGKVAFLWTDELAELRDAGKAVIRRASDVEGDDNGNWIADLSRINLPVLGPFPLRQSALDAERAAVQRELESRSLFHNNVNDSYE